MRDILFMGEILASVTHDMQNIMAIIKESGALADDILTLNGPPRMKHGDKLQDALQNIGAQVRRGRDLMLMLNGFAHAAEDFPDICDLERFAGQISTLAERKVRMKECRFTRIPRDQPLPVRGNALRVMQALYLGLVAVLEGCRAGGSLTLSLRCCDEASHFAATVRLEAEHRETPVCDDEIRKLMRDMGGDCFAGPGLLELSFAPAGAAEIVA